MRLADSQSRPAPALPFRWRTRTAAVAFALTATALSVTAQSTAEAGTGGLAAHGGPFGKQVVGYFTQWGIQSGFYVKNLITSGQINHLTEIDYAFAVPGTDGTCTSADESADYQQLFTAAQTVNGKADHAGQRLAGNFNQLRELKARYPGLRIVMSIGGWAGSAGFSGASMTAASRQKFVASCIDQYIKGNLPGLAPGAAAGIFDGFAIDWEYPDEPGAGNPYGPQDIPDFTALMQEFRAQLDGASARGRERYLLTVDAAQYPQYASQLQLAPVAKAVDWFNVMTFEFYGAVEPTGPTDFASGLYQDPRDPYPAPYQFNVDRIVKYYESQGVRPDQLAIAVPYFARYWTGVNPGPDGDGLFQFAAAGGDSMNYNLVVDQPGTRYFDAATGEPYIYDSASQTFYTYDDPASIALKGQYIWQQGLRGAMVWSLDGDTSDGRLTAALGDSLGVRGPRA